MRTIPPDDRGRKVLRRRQRTAKGRGASHRSSRGAWPATSVTKYARAEAAFPLRKELRNIMLLIMCTNEPTIGHVFRNRPLRCRCVVCYIRAIRLQINSNRSEKKGQRHL